MKITIAMEDVEGDQIRVTEDREPGDAENEAPATFASSLAISLITIDHPESEKANPAPLPGYWGRTSRMVAMQWHKT